MTRSRRVAARLGAVSAAVVLASFVVPVQSASADVCVWRHANFGVPGICWAGGTIEDYRNYRYPNTNYNVNDSASSYENNNPYKLWFFKDSRYRNDNGWSGPWGSGNFGSVLNDEVSSHRPA